MLVLEGILLLLYLGEMWYFIRNDVADYVAFKLLTDTGSRQKRFRIWALKSFLLFSVAAVIGLAILGRLRSLASLPPELRALSLLLQSLVRKGQLPGSGFVVGFCAAVLMGSAAGVVVMKLFVRKSKPKGLGDIEPLMPRNWPETAHTALLSLNAGTSEELFFRLMLPLLITLLFGNALFAFICATILFGALHVYQGLVGVVATTVIGVVFTGLYLLTGNCGS